MWMAETKSNMIYGRVKTSSHRNKRLDVSNLVVHSKSTRLTQPKLLVALLQNLNTTFKTLVKESLDAHIRNKCVSQPELPTFGYVPPICANGCNSGREAIMGSGYGIACMSHRYCETCWWTVAEENDYTKISAKNVLAKFPYSGSRAKSEHDFKSSLLQRIITPDTVQYKRYLRRQISNEFKKLQNEPMQFCLGCVNNIPKIKRRRHKTKARIDLNAVIDLSD